MYAANKIFWFSLRKNRYCSAIYGSIRRFFETYVWCFSIILVLSFCGILYSAYHSEYLSFWNTQEMARYGSAYSSVFLVLCSCLIALILAQRLIFAYFIGNPKIPKDNARFWQYTEAYTSMSFYVFTHFCALAIWEFCYRIAMFVLFLTPWFLVSFGWAVPIFFGELLHIVVCYLAFSFVVRSLFGMVALLTRRTLPRSTG